MHTGLIPTTKGNTNDEIKIFLIRTNFHSKNFVLLIPLTLLSSLLLLSLLTCYPCLSLIPLIKSPIQFVSQSIQEIVVGKTN